MTSRLRFPRTCPICGHPPGRRTIGLPPAFICDRGHSWRVQECPPGQHTMRTAAPGLRRCRDCGLIADEQAGTRHTMMSHTRGGEGTQDG